MTDGLVEAGEPVFDRGGKYLYFLASTDAGPVNNWFDQSNTDMQATSSVYLVTLAKATANPLLRRATRKGPTKPEKSQGFQGPKIQEGRRATKDKEKDKKDAKEKPPVVIDLEGSPAGRGVADPVGAPPGPGRRRRGADLLHPPRGRPAGPGPAGRGKPSLRRFDLKTREEETLAEGIDDFQLSADRKKLLYRSGEPRAAVRPVRLRAAWSLGIVDAGKFNKGDGALKLDAISVRVEPRAEWPQILREAWRINRDYFYATNMHGADWNAMWPKYEALLPDLATRGDLNRVIRMMLSELAVGHSFLGGGERLYEPKPIPVGLLGADYEVADGRFRFKTIYGGAYWDPSLRAPLAAPGVDVKPGEFLLAVDGREIKADSEVYRAFEGTAGKRVELKVGPKADGTGARTVVVEPIADEAALRNRAWVEGNLRKVHERTKGRVAYVYVPNTAGSGYEYFKRYFFPQADKEAIIVDERFNGGGQVADYYIDMLRRPLVSYWATRYGEPLRTPNAAILGPQGDDHRRDGRLGRRPPAVDVPQVRPGQAGRQADLGRAGGHPGLPGPDGRRRGHGARTWRSSPRTAGSSRTWACRPTSRSSRTRPPWPRARTRSSTGPSRWSSRSWPRTRRRSRRPGRRSPCAPGRRTAPRRRGDGAGRPVSQASTSGRRVRRLDSALTGLAFSMRSPVPAPRGPARGTSRRRGPSPSSPCSPRRTSGAAGAPGTCRGRPCWRRRGAARRRNSGR